MANSTMRIKYWVNTKFANWLRGTDKPTSNTASDWVNWHNLASATHPFRYWLAENLLGKLQRWGYAPIDKYYDFIHYIKNRWIINSHALTSSSAHIKRGHWCDLSNRILPCLFDELVDFVEIEIAATNLWSVDNKEKYQISWQDKLPWNTWRSAELGVEYLEWMGGLVNEPGYCHKKDVGKPTSHALAAKEILDLYYWWKEEYPNREDPGLLSGWIEYCAQRRTKSKGESIFHILDHDNATSAEKSQIKQMLDKEKKIEEQYKKEEEQMMIRLIKVRSYLWT
jgi:hypothetical protein